MLGTAAPPGVNTGMLAPGENWKLRGWTGVNFALSCVDQYFLQLNLLTNYSGLNIPWVLILVRCNPEIETVVCEGLEVVAIHIQIFTQIVEKRVFWKLLPSRRSLTLALDYWAPQPYRSINFTSIMTKMKNQIQVLQGCSLSWEFKGNVVLYFGLQKTLFGRFAPVD